MTTNTFFVNEAIELQSRDLLKCLPHEELGKATSQFMFERDVYLAALLHPKRTYDLEALLLVRSPR